ncbi:MAG: hypothetical protein ACERKZ_11360 [Lachnotalea sp.]|nr:hypothetical protein [Candidatus Galacturonibacter soehngenii]
MNNSYNSKVSKNNGITLQGWCPCKGNCTLGCSGNCTFTCAGSCAGNSAKNVI